jgi:putative acetyltransferase
MFHIARARLKENGLDVPGSVYFDDVLRHLSQYYNGGERGASHARRAYFVAVEHNDDNRVLAGAGFAEYGNGETSDTAELQKLYAREASQGRGISYALIDAVERAAAADGYTRLYLETEHRLTAALHIYEKLGFTRLDRPPVKAQHSAMDRFYIESLLPEE